jgi:hypothetical protein
MTGAVPKSVGSETESDTQSQQATALWFLLSNRPRNALPGHFYINEIFVTRHHDPMTHLVGLSLKYLVVRDDLDIQLFQLSSAEYFFPRCIFEGARDGTALFGVVGRYRRSQVRIECIVDGLRSWQRSTCRVQRIGITRIQRHIRNKGYLLAEPKNVFAFDALLGKLIASVQHGLLPSVDVRGEAQGVARGRCK